MNISQKLKNRRKELGLTMLEVSQKVGVSEATVSRWESGDIANMRRDKIVLLANALQVTPSFIMNYEDNVSPSTKPDITFDDFTYAMYNETKELTEEDKDALLNMARVLKKKTHENTDRKITPLDPGYKLIAFGGDNEEDQPPIPEQTT